MRALKEWASVVEAMRGGDHTVILRKGGILEVASGFRIAVGDEFALYPTYEHQEPAHIKESAQKYMAAAGAGRPGGGGGGGGGGGEGGGGASAAVRACARVVAEADVASDAALEALSPMHVWSSAYVRARRDWKPDRPVKAAYLRVYELPGAVMIPDRPEYGGCRSWIDVEWAGGRGGWGGGGLGGAPVLDDAEAGRRRAQFSEAVSL